MFTFEAHPRGLNTFCMTFVPGEKPILATAGKDGVRVWDLTTRESIRHLDTAGKNPASLTCSLNGQLLILSQGKDPTIIRLWDWNKDRVVKEIDGGTRVQCALFSPDQKTLAIGGYRLLSSRVDCNVRRLSVATWKPQRLLRGHTSQTGFLAFSPNSKFLASGAEDKEAILWDLKTGEALLTIQHQTAVWGVAYRAV